MPPVCRFPMLSLSALMASPCAITALSLTKKPIATAVHKASHLKRRSACFSREPPTGKVVSVWANGVAVRIVRRHKLARDFAIAQMPRWRPLCPMFADVAHN